MQFLATDDLTQEAVERAEKITYAGVPTKNPTPEHLIAIAVRTGRSKDKTRVEMLLQKADRKILRGILKRHTLTGAYGKLMGSKP